MADLEGKALSLTPTWAVASVTAVFVILSLLIELSIHLVSRWLLKTKRKPLYQSLEKMKDELMLLGFISLFMSFLPSFFSRLCINASFYDRQFSMCKQSEVEADRTIFVFGRFVIVPKIGDEDGCPKGKEAFISLGDIHEIHRLLFVMAFTHIFYSCMTVALALIRIHTWSTWEQEACSDEYDSYVEITRDTPLKRQFVFALYHASKPWSLKRSLVWMACFARQFGQSVNRADYLTIRSGFITVHNLEPNFNFHSYLNRSIEDDFTRIVGIRFKLNPAYGDASGIVCSLPTGFMICFGLFSSPLWGFAILLLLLNVDGTVYSHGLWKKKDNRKL